MSCGLQATSVKSPATSDATEPDCAASILQSLDSSRAEARKRVKDSHHEVRAARKVHRLLCISAAVAYKEKDAVLRDIKRATVLAECQRFGLAALKAAYNNLFRGARDASQLLVGLDSPGEMALIVDTLDLLCVETVGDLKQKDGANVDRVGGGSELVLRFAPALHRACLLMRHDTQHDTLLERAERNHLYNKFIPFLEREQTHLRNPVIHLLHGCREPATLAAAADDDPAAISAANILLELVNLLSPSGSPTYFPHDLICPPAAEAQLRFWQYLAILAAEEQSEELRQKREILRTQLLQDVLHWAEKVHATSGETSEIEITRSGWVATPARLNLQNPGLAKAVEMLWAGERSKDVLCGASQGGAIEKVLENVTTEELGEEAKDILRQHSKGLRFLRGDYFSVASQRQVFDQLVLRRRDVFINIAKLAAEAQLQQTDSEKKDARRAQEYMLESVRQWRSELGPELEQVVEALLKLWAGERNITVLSDGLPHEGIGALLLRHVLRITTTEVARAIEEDNVKAQTTLRQHDRLLRTIARIACSPLEQAGMDQTKCLQACTDLEDSGVRLFDATLAIFTGERDPSVVCRGLDRTDQALARQILGYISQGSAQMTGPGWDGLDVDTILAGRGGGSASSFGSGSEYSGGSGFGTGMGSGGGGERSEFWRVVEAGPLVDRMGRTHNPTQLQLKSNTAIGVFFSGHWCPPSSRSASRWHSGPM